MQIELTIPVVCSGLGAVGILSGFAFYIGDGRWRKKTEDDATHKDITTRIAMMETKVTEHNVRLDEGSRTMAKLEGMVQQQGISMGNIHSAVARIEGRLQNPGL